MEAVGRASGDGVRLGDRDETPYLPRSAAHDRPPMPAPTITTSTSSGVRRRPIRRLHRRDGGGGGRRAGREDARARGGRWRYDARRERDGDELERRSRGRRPHAEPGRAAACAPCANEDMTASPQVSRRDACPAGCGTRRDGHPAGHHKASSTFPRFGKPIPRCSTITPPRVSRPLIRKTRNADSSVKSL